MQPFVVGLTKPSPCLVSPLSKFCDVIHFVIYSFSFSISLTPSDNSVDEGVLLGRVVGIVS
jgi:hypothetical protein